MTDKQFSLIAPCVFGMFWLLFYISWLLETKLDIIISKL